MQNTFSNNFIDISILSKSAKVELLNYYEYLLFRHKTKNNTKVNELVKQIISKENETSSLNENMTKKEFLDFLKKGFTISEDELNKIEDTQKEINQWKIEAF
jgi:hypothetical protein